MNRSLVILSLSILMMAQVQAAAPRKLSADFRQTKTSSMYKGEKVSTGHFVYNAPDYVKWEYLQPTHRCWETSSAKKNSNPAFATIVSVIKDCIAGNFESNRKFRITKEGNTFTLVPQDRNIAEIVAMIVITLNAKTQLAQTVVLIEKNGNCTTITFSNVKAS